MQVAICGCGWAGARHADALAAAGAPLRWAIDRDPARARALAARHPGARAADDLAPALEDPVVGAVAVCLPHAAHAGAVARAARAGRHVLCEKPLAPALAEADAAIAAADAAGVALAVVDNQAHDPAYARVAAALRNGAVGRVALAEVRREGDHRAAFLAGRPGFLEPGGGVLLSGAVHDVATLRRLLGEVRSARALAPPARIPEMADEDTAAVLLAFESGAVGVLVESFATRAPETAGGAEVHALRLAGDAGVLDLGADRVLRIAGPGGETRERIAPADTFAGVARAFLAEAARTRPGTTQAREHRLTLAVVLEARASLAARGG